MQTPAKHLLIPKKRLGVFFFALGQFLEAVNAQMEGQRHEKSESLMS